MQTSAPPVEAYLTVTSIPSGAEIWIDKKFTGLTTTNRVKVPANRPFSLMLRSQGYVDYKKPDIDMRNSPPQMTVTLLENKLAYVDIDLIPPKNARLFINGMPFGDGVPRKHVPVPAEVNLRLKVEDTSGNTDETVLEPMKQNSRKRVVLFPRNHSKSD